MVKHLKSLLKLVQTAECDGITTEIRTKFDPDAKTWIFSLMNYHPREKSKDFALLNLLEKSNNHEKLQCKPVSFLFFYKVFEWMSSRSGDKSVSISILTNKLEESKRQLENMLLTFVDLCWPLLTFVGLCRTYYCSLS